MVRLGLIGLGQAAQILHLPNLERMEDKFKITAVADVSQELSGYIAHKYHVEHQYTDAMELIACPDVDAVMIMRAGDHAGYAAAALRAGKHVFIEKPMTLDIERARELIAVKEQHPELVAMVGYCRRYNGSFLKMKELLHQDDRPISYVRARTLILEGPWYLENTWHEKKAGDLDPAGRAAMQQATIGEAVRLMGNQPDRAQILAFLLLAGSGCHILSAVRELIGLPKSVEAAIVSPNGMQFTLILSYEGFNLVFEEMNDQQIVDFDESIEIYQGNRKMHLRYDSPYIRSLPSRLEVSELENGQARVTTYGPDYRDMFASEIKEFYRCISEHDTPKCDIYDAAEDVQLFLDIAKKFKTC